MEKELSLDYETRLMKTLELLDTGQIAMGYGTSLFIMNALTRYTDAKVQIPFILQKYITAAVTYQNENKTVRQKGRPTDRDFAFYTMPQAAMTHFLNLIQDGYLEDDAAKEIEKQYPEVMGAYESRRVKKSSLSMYVRQGFYLPAFIGATLRRGRFPIGGISIRTMDWIKKKFPMIKEDTFQSYLKDKSIVQEWIGAMRGPFIAQFEQEHQELHTLEKILHDYKLISPTENILIQDFQPNNDDDTTMYRALVVPKSLQS